MFFIYIFKQDFFVYYLAIFFQSTVRFWIFGLRRWVSLFVNNERNNKIREIISMLGFKRSILAGGALARGRDGFGEILFDWLDSWTKIFSHSRLVSFPNLSTAWYLSKAVQLQHLRTLTDFNKRKFLSRGKILTGSDIQSFVMEDWEGQVDLGFWGRQWCKTVNGTRIYT
jgi:hypothetical protein